MEKQSKTKQIPKTPVYDIKKGGKMRGGRCGFSVWMTLALPHRVTSSCASCASPCFSVLCGPPAPSSQPACYIDAGNRGLELDITICEQIEDQAQTNNQVRVLL